MSTSAVIQLPVAQRSRGHAALAMAVRGGAVRLADLSQRGSAKVFLPRVPGPVPQAVFLNTSGGLTDGDRLDYAIDLGAGCDLVATTQTAERAYAGRGAAAQAGVSAQLDAGARLDWLPQETILFAQSWLERRTELDLAADATCLLAETVVLGRQAMGERATDVRLSDRRMIRRRGRPFWADALKIGPGWLSDASNPAVLGGARCFAVLMLAASGAEAAAAPLRALALPSGTALAVSGWDGKCVARLIAADSWPLKVLLARMIRTLAGTVPRVWQVTGDETCN